MRIYKLHGKFYDSKLIDSSDCCGGTHMHAEAVKT